MMDVRSPKVIKQDHLVLLEDSEWPDYIEIETGFIYQIDNRYVKINEDDTIEFVLDNARAKYKRSNISLFGRRNTQIYGLIEGFRANF